MALALYVNLLPINWNDRDVLARPFHLVEHLGPGHEILADAMAANRARRTDDCGPHVVKIVLVGLIDLKVDNLAIIERNNLSSGFVTAPVFGYLNVIPVKPGLLEHPIA